LPKWLTSYDGHHFLFFSWNCFHFLVVSDKLYQDKTDGREALKAVLAKWFKAPTKGKVDIQHIGADGDFVYLHLKNKLPNGGLESNIDIF
jgi:predicted SnoaL-like aldol condensation-catalyzing enzyme